MATIKSMMGSGVSAEAAKGIGGTIATGLTATGSTSQADSFAIAADCSLFSTVAANTGARLPATAEVGSTIEIYNGGASTLFVYPHVGGQINILGANTKIDVSTKKGAQFKRLTDAHWGAVGE